LHQAVVLVELCHIALLHAIQTNERTLLALAIISTVILGEAGELISPQSIVLHWLLLRLCFYAGWPNIW